VKTTLPGADARRRRSRASSWPRPAPTPAAPRAPTPPTPHCAPDPPAGSSAPVRARKSDEVGKKRRVDSPMPLVTVGVRVSAAAQSKLSPRMEYAGCSWAPMAYSGREQALPAPGAASAPTPATHRGKGPRQQPIRPLAAGIDQIPDCVSDLAARALQRFRYLLQLLRHQTLRLRNPTLRRKCAGSTALPSALCEEGVDRLLQRARLACPTAS
jgi:hypothetical protein